MATEHTNSAAEHEKQPNKSIEQRVWWAKR
jgi:hypothetical protein